MDKMILHDLSVRFLFAMSEEETQNPTQLYIILEEAHWFYMDFYTESPKLGFRTFIQRLLQHNNMKFIESDYKNFQKYKRTVPVYGALLINQKFDKILLVKGYNQQCFFFPKGKMNKDEDPKDCAIRETFEEVGYDIQDKILDVEIPINNRFSVFPVINVDDGFEFITRTRNEIEHIRWVSIEDLGCSNEPSLYNIKDVYKHFKYFIDDLKETRFKFDRRKIEEAMM